MARRGKTYRNQDVDQILKHLKKLLKPGTRYNLTTDPLDIYFEIKESNKQPKKASDKMKKLREQSSHLSKRKRRLVGTKKRIRPKIRSVKKGRTVNLKGVSY